MRSRPRVGRPLSVLGHTARSLRSRAVRRRGPSAGAAAGRYDSWLKLFDAELTRIDAACAGGGPDSLVLFRELDADLWALLLTQEYDAYPNIRARLPDVPDPALQRLWNGTCGIGLANQSREFYDKLCRRYRQHSDRALADSRVLDFGCGWGRLTRFLARDVQPGHLYGCDPVEQILDICRDSGVPASLARSDFVPERVPFDVEFDLAFSFSVFTHISEAAHESCLRALHRALCPDGILVLTVRPPEYLSFSAMMRPALDSLGPDPEARLQEPHYLFVPHPAEPSHLQYEGGDMTYGETVVTLPYVRERWSSMFELLDVDVLVGDLHQVMLTMRRRGGGCD